jgi:hypothetical protein
MIVNDLIIGRLEKAAPAKIMSISNIDRNSNISGSIKTIEFKEKENHSNYLLISKNYCPLLDPL